MLFDLWNTIGIDYFLPNLFDVILSFLVETKSVKIVRYYLLTYTGQYSLIFNNPGYLLIMRN